MSVTQIDLMVQAKEMKFFYRAAPGRYLLAILTALSITTTLSASGPWRPHVGPEGQGGNFKRGGGVDAWVPFCQTGSSLFFVQGGGGYFRDAATGSFGWGYRQLRPSGQWALGVNSFVDVAYPDSNRGAFGQVGAGVELFQCHWLARGNLYVPFTKSKRLRLATETSVFVEGLSIVEETIQRDIRERAFSGVDGEVGYEQALGCGRLGLYGGYFYYKKSSFSPIHGPRARVEYRIDQGCCWPNNRGEVIFGAEYERDRIHGQTALLRAGWRFFFGCKKRSCCCVSPLLRYMGRRVLREKTVWVDEISSDPVLIDRIQIGNIIFANNVIDGIGTQTNPATLPNALSMLAENNVLFLLEDTGDITPTLAVTTPDGVQILGFGNALTRLVTLPGLGSFVVTDLTGAGRATLIDTGLDPVIETVDNNFICGIEIQDGATGVRQGAGIGPVRIEDVVFTDQTVAILNDGGGDLTVDRTQITGAGLGIRALNAAGDVIITGTPTTNTQITADDGIDIDAPTAGMTRIFNTTINATIDGILLSNNPDTRIDGVTMTAGGEGLRISDLASLVTPDVRLLNSTINATGTGVAGTLARGGVLVIDKNSITASVAEAIRLDFVAAPGSWDVLISNNPTLIGGSVVGSVIDIGTSIGAALVDAQVSNNSLITTSVIQRAIGVNFESSGNNVSLLNNGQTGVFGFVPGYEVDQPIGVVGTNCVTLIGNSRAVSIPPDISLSAAVGTLEVWDLGNLSATNTGLTVSTAGTVIQAAGPCPLPVITP